MLKIPFLFIGLLFCMGAMQGEETMDSSVIPLYFQIMNQAIASPPANTDAPSDPKALVQEALVRLGQADQLDTVAQLGFISAFYTPVFTLNELEQLWRISKKSDSAEPFSSEFDLYTLVSVYVAGKIVAQKIHAYYAQLDADKLMKPKAIAEAYVHATAIPSAEEWNSYMQKVLKAIPPQSANEGGVSKFRLQTLRVLQYLPALVRDWLNKIHFAKLVSMYDMAVGAQYGMRWAHAYVQAEDKKPIERKLIALQPHTLLAVSQRLLVRGRADFPYAFASYVLAATRDKKQKPRMQYFLNLLIQHKQSHVFESLLKQYQKSQ